MKPFGDNRVGRLAWFAVVLLWPVGLLNYMDRLVITSMRDAILESVPMTEAQFGLLTSVFLWVYGVSSFVAGYLADRFSRRWMIIGSLIAWSVCTWMTGQAHTYRELFLSRAGLGIAEACYLPAALALICDYHRTPTRSRAIGVHGTGLFAGIALSGAGGYVAQDFGWRAGFVVLGAVGVGYAFVLMRFLADIPADEPRPDGAAAHAKPSHVRLDVALRSLAAQPSYWLLLAGLLLLGIAIWLVYGWLPTYLHEHFHMGLGAGGLSATGYTQLATVAGLLIGGYWADRWAQANVRGRMFVAALGCIVGALALFLMAATDTLAVAIGALLVFGTGMGFYNANTMPMLRQVADERYSATGMGILDGFSCIAGGLMTYVGGALRDHHVDLALSFRAVAVGVLITGLLVLRLRPLPLVPREAAAPG